MIAAGVIATTLGTHMAHSTIWITIDRYGHLMRANENDPATLLEACLAPRAPRSRRFAADSAGVERAAADPSAHG